MLRRDFMPSSHNAALEKREGRFYCVCVYVPMRVLFRVIDSPMEVLLHLVECVGIDLGLVGHNDFDVSANIRVDDIPNGLGLRIPSPDQPQVPIPLPDADNYRLLTFWTPPASLATYIGFVNLDRAAKFLWRYFQHGSADAMAEVPRGFIADSERTLNLASRHSLFGFAEQAGCKEPLPQRQVSIMEDGLGGHAELVRTIVTDKLIAFENAVDLARTTFQT